MRFLTLLGLPVVGLLAGCAAFVPEPDPSDAGRDAEVLRDLRVGRELYVEKCAGCHRLYDVDAYADDEWRTHVQEMVGENKVRLTKADHASLLRYLTTLNGKPRP
jgi:hypothetical protein